MSLSERDAQLIWHPFTQEQTAGLKTAIVRGEGAFLYDSKNKAYLDLNSSWWVNLHGHANPLITEAIHKQAQELEHVIFAGFTHQPAISLCENLKTILPQELCKFFFSDNGSTAVEVALKMAYQYWWNKGQEQRRKFICLEGAYHGDTFGAMSVGKGSCFHQPFREFFFETNPIPYAYSWEGDLDRDQKERESLTALKDLLEKNHQEIAAFIIEPLVQGASGMRICRKEYLQQLIQMLREHEILIIFDEVMTGFGRTGTNFALDQLAVVPDLLCLSKGLTGGFLPMALTVANQKIYEAFLDQHFDKAFAHGHSYTANPLACAAGLASFQILQSKETQAAIKAINLIHHEGLKLLQQELDFVSAIRDLGTIAAFNLGDDNADYDYKFSREIEKDFLAEGLLIRPLGKTIYLLPPYCIDLEDLKTAYQTILKILKKI